MDSGRFDKLHFNFLKKSTKKPAFCVNIQENTTAITFFSSLSLLRIALYKLIRC